MAPVLLGLGGGVVDAFYQEGARVMAYQSIIVRSYQEFDGDGVSLLGGHYKGPPLVTSEYLAIQPVLCWEAKRAMQQCVTTA